MRKSQEEEQLGEAKAKPLFPRITMGGLATHAMPAAFPIPGDLPSAGPRTRLAILLGIAARIREKY
jgi:hypothetical protein